MGGASQSGVESASRTIETKNRRKKFGCPEQRRESDKDTVAVSLRLTDTVNVKDELPFPWEKKKTLYEENGTAKSGLRAKVVWQLINSSNGKDPLTLAQVDQFHKSIKARSFHALIDALNGGQSAKSVSWGKNFIELYVIPKQ